jgi:serralysin
MENLTGSAFADTLTGNAGANTLNGNAGSDALNGGDGNDTLDGGAGDDVMNGGAGVDTASYARATAGVTVNLGNALAQNTVGAGTDTLAGIENAHGSNFADTLIGSAGANTMLGTGGDDIIGGRAGNDSLDGGAGNDTLNGEDGNDTLTGGAGNDFLDGGNGVDTASYASSAAGVAVDLAAFSATGGAGVDTVLNVENVTGSGLADTLRGDSAANVLNGGLGNDTIRGGAGNDTLTGGGGNDKFEWIATLFNSVDLQFGNLDRVTDLNAGDSLDFTAGLEALLTVNGTALGASAANVALGNTFNVNTNVCLSGTDLCIDLDNSHSFTASDFRVQLVGLATGVTYDAAADTFHI